MAKKARRQNFSYYAVNLKIVSEAARGVEELHNRSLSTAIKNIQVNKMKNEKKAINKYKIFQSH